MIILLILALIGCYFSLRVIAAVFTLIFTLVGLAFALLLPFIGLVFLGILIGSLL
jgi:hypothetical protein